MPKSEETQILDIKTPKIKKYIKNNKLFNSGYFDLAEGMIITLIVFTILAILVPSRGLIEHADVIFSAATFLFGIAAGYYVANRHDRYSQIRSAVSQESSYLIDAYINSKMMSDKFCEEVTEAIEAYMLSTYFYKLEDYVIGTEDTYNRISEKAAIIRKDLRDQDVVAEKFLDSIINLNYIREQIYILGQDKLTTVDWGSLIILAILIFLSLFSIGFDNIALKIIAIVLSSTLMLLIFIIRDLDSLKRNEKLMIYGTYDRVFDKMGRPRIYLKKDVKEGLITPVPDKEFRLLEENGTI